MVVFNTSIIGYEFYEKTIAALRNSYNVKVEHILIKLGFIRVRRGLNESRFPNKYPEGKRWW